MWSFTQERMVSSLEEAVEDPKKVRNRRKNLFCKFLYYSCCFMKDPYKCSCKDECVHILDHP